MYSSDLSYIQHQDADSYHPDFNQLLDSDISVDLLGFQMNELFEKKKRRREGVHLKRANQAQG